MTPARLALLVLLVVVSVQAAGAATAGAPGRSRTVPCGEIIEQTRFPYLGSSQPRYRSRLVLDALSVPPAFLPQINPTGERPWRYFSKWGMVVRSDGRSATVTVPPAWRDRLAISWGNAGHGVFQSIHFAGCRHGPNVGNAYAGGFFLTVPAACVPLLFSVGGRSTVFRFGIGRRCR